MKASAFPSAARLAASEAAPTLRAFCSASRKFCISSLLRADLATSIALSAVAGSRVRSTSGSPISRCQSAAAAASFATAAVAASGSGEASASACVLASVSANNLVACRIESGVALGANDDEAARRLRLIVARRGELLEVDQQRLRGDVGALSAFDPRRRNEDRAADSGENRKNDGESQRELAGDRHIGERHEIDSSSGRAWTCRNRRRRARVDLMSGGPATAGAPAALRETLAAPGYADVNAPLRQRQAPAPGSSARL